MIPITEIIYNRLPNGIEDLQDLLNTIEKYNSTLTDLYDTYFSRIREQYYITLESMSEQSDTVLSDVLKQLKYHRGSLSTIEDLVVEYVKKLSDLDPEKLKREARLKILLVVDELSTELTELYSDINSPHDIIESSMRDITDSLSTTQSLDQSNLVLDAYIEQIDKWINHVEDYRRMYGYPIFSHVGWVEEE